MSFKFVHLISHGSFMPPATVLPRGGGDMTSLPFGTEGRNKQELSSLFSTFLHVYFLDDVF